MEDVLRVTSRLATYFSVCHLLVVWLHLLTFPWCQLSLKWDNLLLRPGCYRYYNRSSPRKYFNNPENNPHYTSPPSPYGSHPLRGFPASPFSPGSASHKALAEHTVWTYRCIATPSIYWENPPLSSMQPEVKNTFTQDPAQLLVPANHSVIAALERINASQMYAP